MRAGMMREVITIQAEATTTDELGGMVSVWTEQTTCWAEVMPITGYEKFNYGQVYNKVDFKMRIRHRTNVTTKHRVLWRTRKFNVEYIQNELGKYQELILYVSEVI